MQEVTDFLRHQLRLEASPEKSKVSKATDGTVFLGYTVQTVTTGQNPAEETRKAASCVHAPTLTESTSACRANGSCGSTNVKGYGDLGRLKAMHRRHLIDSSMLEIVLAYNAEMRGIANYYRLAYCVKFHPSQALVPLEN